MDITPVNGRQLELGTYIQGTAKKPIIMSMVAVPEVLETVLLGVVERSIAVASDRLVGGRLKLQQLEAAMDILQGKDVHVPLKEGKAKRFNPYLWFAALVCQLVLDTCSCPCTATWTQNS